MKHDPSTAQKRIAVFVQKVEGNAPLTDAEFTEALDLFEEYECWQPFMQLMHVNSGKLKNKTPESFDFLLRLARAQNLYLEDVFSSADTCCFLVKSFKLSYEDFKHRVIAQVIEKEDFATESSLLSAVTDLFTEVSDQIACLERLCLLYEKKTFNENQLTDTYEKLLNIDPFNLKALRYFKLVLVQENDWDDVAMILRKLLKAVRHPEEVFRVAQELAAVELYHLDKPQQAIDTINKFCHASPLDTSTILFDANQRVGNWEGCLQVLRECLLGIDDPQAAGVLHFKSAAIYEHLQDLNQAKKHYEQSISADPTFLEAYEGMLAILILEKSWKEVSAWLMQLKAHVEDETLASQLLHAEHRLQDALQAGN